MKEKRCTFISSPLESFEFGYDIEDPKCKALKLQIAQYINDMYREGIRVFTSICQQGPDLWAAEVIALLMEYDPTVELHCVLPYEEQAAKWHSDFRESYYNVLAKATTSSFIDGHYSPNCMTEARMMTLSLSKYVLAVVSNDDKNNPYLDFALHNAQHIVVLTENVDSFTYKCCRQKI